MKMLLTGLLLLSSTTFAAEAPADRGPPYQAEFNKCVKSYAEYCEKEPDTEQCKADISIGCSIVAECLSKHDYLKTSDPKEENKIIGECIDEATKKRDGSNTVRIDHFKPVLEKFNQ